jgi:asparaginyl-tRNA synthetase
MRKKISTIKQEVAQGTLPLGAVATIKGWIKTIRKQKTFSFIEVNDGSCFSNMQVIINDTLPEYQSVIEKAATGASVSITGSLVASQGQGQKVEIHATAVALIGECDATTYPLQKKHHSLEFLREIAHLRPRTNTIGAVTRVRNALSYATHRFFQERGFLYIHTPIITASDCEGAGEMFRVTTLPDHPRQKSVAPTGWDYSEDFFEKPAYLTVSGQLNGEIYACGLSDIYTFGPTFRAENSNTSRHLAEFWMIEPEMAFADIYDNMDCAEAYLKYCLQYVLEVCAEDLAFFDAHMSKGLVERLKKVVEASFERVTYTDAIELLLKAKASGVQFQFPIEWGIDLQSEHERYLTDELFGKPVIVINYPRQIKSFYMRDNEDGKTVAAMDILVPGVGEIIGGSQREERYDLLEKKIIEFGLDPKSYWWYLELRKYGSVPHAGFGLGLERLIRYATGMENIRDVIPFPRYPGSVSF